MSINDGVDFVTLVTQGLWLEYHLSKGMCWLRILMSVTTYHATLLFALVDFQKIDLIKLIHIIKRNDPI